MNEAMNLLGERLKKLTDEEESLTKCLNDVGRELNEIDTFTDQKHREWQVKRDEQTAKIADELANLGLKLTTEEERDLNCWVPKVISDKKQLLIGAKINFDSEDNLMIAALYAAFQAANRLLLSPEKRTELLDKVAHLKIFKESGNFKREWLKNWRKEYKLRSQQLRNRYETKDMDYSLDLEREESTANNSNAYEISTELKTR